MASRGINFPKHSHPNNCFSRSLMEVQGYAVVWQLQPILEVSVDDIYPKIWLLFESHFRVFSAPSRIATWGWHPFFERFASQSSPVFFAAMQAPPPNKKSGENRKYQPLNTKSQIDLFRIFAARGPFQADSSSVHLCCDWALMPFLLCCLVLAASVAPCPLVRPGVNYPLYFFGI